MIFLFVMRLCGSNVFTSASHSLLHCLFCYLQTKLTWGYTGNPSGMWQRDATLTEMNLKVMPLQEMNLFIGQDAYQKLATLTSKVQGNSQMILPPCVAIACKRIHRNVTINATISLKLFTQMYMALKIHILSLTLPIIPILLGLPVSMSSTKSAKKIIQTVHDWSNENSSCLLLLVFLWEFLVGN